MIAYLLPYFCIAFTAFFEMFASRKLKLVLAILMLYSLVLMLLFLGLRDGIGPDWSNYVSIYQYVGEQESIWRGLQRTEFGYALLNAISYSVGGGVYLVNFLCALLIFLGLLPLLNRYPERRWFILSQVFPYLIVIVSMGYSRQGVAAAFLIGALVNFRSLRVFYLFFLVGVLFHLSILPFALLPLGRWLSLSRRIAVLVLGGCALAFGVIAVKFIGELAMFGRLAFYLNSDLDSAGVYFRIVNIVGAAGLYVAVYSRIEGWLRDALLGIYLFFLFLLPFVSISTTLVDRMVPYLFAIYLVMTVEVLRILSVKRRVVFGVLVLVYMLVWFGVWLAFSSHVQGAWVPYKNIIAESF